MVSMKCLVFISIGLIDNTFSRNKAKTLTFSVALVEGGMQSSSSQYEISGWLLKKKRKKMQGNETCDWIVKRC